MVEIKTICVKVTGDEAKEKPSGLEQLQKT
jgi:hypothetical protein